jgi:uncharacterized membrane protein
MIAAIDVNLPVDKVFDLFLDKEKFPAWKVGFVKYELLSGTPGAEGCVTKLIYKKYTMIETVLQINKPHQYTTQYDHMQNNQVMLVHKAVNKFIPIGGGTRIEVESEVVKTNNFFTAIIMKLFAKAGEKQFHDQLKLFKTLAEKN